jgi:hypothetical protein
MPVSDKRLIEVLSFENANGVEKTKDVYGASDGTLVRYRALARSRSLDIPEHSKESKEITGQAASLDEFLAKNNIDLDIWEVAHWEIIEGDWDVSSKERSQNLTWTVEKDEKGNKRQFMEGDAKRGGWETKTNQKHSFKVKLVPRKYAFDRENFVKEMRDLMRIETTSVPRLPKKKGKYCLEVCLFDVHLGRLAWAPETGADYDSKITRERFFTAIEQFIAQAETYPIAEILFPFGNDFFNSDSDFQFSKTTAGTPQQNDLRWQKSFKMGCEMIIKAVNRLRQIAPVTLMGIPGNHDLQKTFYLGEVLEMKFENDKNVTVDNAPSTTKYYQYGKCLIGLNHGKDIPLKRLPLLMPQEAPIMWSQTEYREWHLGHMHHTKTDTTNSAEDVQGVIIRHLSSITGRDSYEARKGYFGLGSAQAFLWHKEEGLKSQFIHNL